MCLWQQMMVYGTAARIYTNYIGSPFWTLLLVFVCKRTLSIKSIERNYQKLNNEQYRKYYGYNRNKNAVYFR